MTDEQKQEGESQEVGENVADEETNEEKETDDDVVLPPQPDFEADEEMEPPSVAPASKEPLRDPHTGELLRDQDPGVPESNWVGGHKITDVDDTKEPAIAETDFGKE